MHARFEVVEVSLHGKSRFLHEIGREKSVDGLHGPGMVFDVSIGESKFHDLIDWLCIHVCSAPHVVTAHSSRLLRTVASGLLPRHLNEHNVTRIGILHISGRSGLFHLVGLCARARGCHGDHTFQIRAFDREVNVLRKNSRRS